MIMMKKTFAYSFFFILLFCGIFQAQAQKITVETRIDSTSILIGEQTNFSLEVTQQPGQNITFPLFSDIIPGGLEIVEPLKIDTIQGSDNNIIVRHNYRVTAFEDSLLYIPPFPVVADSDTVWSKSASLKVVQPFAIDMEENSITDIKTVYTPPVNWKGIIKIALLVILLLALIAGLYILIKKYIQKKPVEEPLPLIPDEPAHIIALRELNRIREQKLWQQERIKEYYTDLTDVIRTYTGRMFNINAREMTSDELLNSLSSMRKEQKEVYEKLSMILKTADLVKFAKWKPLPTENETCLNNAFYFIESTKAEEQEEEKVVFIEEKENKDI